MSDKKGRKDVVHNAPNRRRLTVSEVDIQDTMKQLNGQIDPKLQQQTTPSKAESSKMEETDSKGSPKQVNSINTRRASKDVAFQKLFEEEGEDRRGLMIQAQRVESNKKDGDHQVNGTEKSYNSANSLGAKANGEDKEEHNRRRSTIITGVVSNFQKSYDEKRTTVEGMSKLNMDKLNELGVSVSCKKGLKPESPNQDDFFIYIDDTNIRIYGVCDGHGPYGHRCSNFVAKNLPHILVDDPMFEAHPDIALKSSFIKTHRAMVTICEETKEFDCKLSGTTVTVVIHRGDHLYVAHCGDSRAVLGRGRKASKKKVEHFDLTQDHKPTLPEERKRIKASGGEVKKLEGDIPYRVFAKGRTFPGLAMSRAVGDLIANGIGVTEEPDVRVYKIDETKDRFFLVCTDGVWEFIKSKYAIDLVGKAGEENVKDATERLTKLAWDLWIENEIDVVDDITAILVYL